MEAKKKKHILPNLGSKGKVLENFTFDLDVPKSIPLDENKEQRIWKSHTLRSFVRWIEPRSWHFKVWALDRGILSFLFLEVEDDSLSKSEGNPNL